MNEQHDLTPAPGWTFSPHQRPLPAKQPHPRSLMMLRVCLRAFTLLTWGDLTYLRAALTLEMSQRKPAQLTDRQAAVAAYWRELYKKTEGEHVEPR